MLSAVRNTLRSSINNTVRLFQTSTLVATEKFNHKRIPADDEGVQGEKIVDLDSVLKAKRNLYPTAESDFQLYDGVPYKDLAICNVRVSHNNTIFTVTDAAGTVKLIRSCGMEGFKNTKKGTNIAAQTTAISIANKAMSRGIKTIRVRVQGLGPGRLVLRHTYEPQINIYYRFGKVLCQGEETEETIQSAVKGLQMGGLDIVSVTDNTHVSWNPPRPRKARRL